MLIVNVDYINNHSKWFYNSPWIFSVRWYSKTLKWRKIHRRVSHHWQYDYVKIVLFKNFQWFIKCNLMLHLLKTMLLHICFVINSHCILSNKYIQDYFYFSLILCLIIKIWYFIRILFHSIQSIISLFHSMLVTQAFEEVWCWALLI